MNNFRVYPAVYTAEDRHGVFPVDFMLETILHLGLDWFRNSSKAPQLVFGHLASPWLKTAYGDDKIEEIAAYIRKYEIKIVQHFAMIDAQVPCISLQLLDGNEETSRTALADFAESIDVLNAQDEVLGRTEIGYAPVIDNIHIGIHNVLTPDLTKYLYYLVIYILSSYKPQLEERGLQLGTFRATDVSRMIEYLPENMFSRFINFSVFSIATFSKGDVPIITDIQGIHVAEGDDVIVDPAAESEEVSEQGVTVLDTE